MYNLCEQTIKRFAQQKHHAMDAKISDGSGSTLNMGFGVLEMPWRNGFLRHGFSPFFAKFWHAYLMIFQSGVRRMKKNLPKLLQYVSSFLLHFKNIRICTYLILFILFIFNFSEPEELPVLSPKPDLCRVSNLLIYR